MAASIYILHGGSTSYAVDLEITVEKVSGKESTYRATDNLIPLSGSQTWHFIVIIPSGTCNADAFSGVNAISYVEGDDQTVAISAGTATICFRSSTPVLVGDPTVLYGGITSGDNVGPRVGNVITYRPNARVFNSDNIGDNLVIRVEFDDKVDVDYNGGLGPRLKTNVGTNRYAYVEDGTVLRPRGIWTFHLILQAGDNAADLDVLGWENNGATVEDEAGNPFLPATADSYFPGHLAANHAVTVDTSPPVITVGLVVGNQVSATATDNLDSSVTFFKARPMTAAGTCDSSGSPNFSDYTAGTEFRLAVGFRACFHAKDAAGNSAYALSTAGLAPPTVSVNPSSDHSNPKRAITVRASSSSPGLVTSSWKNKNIAGLATCDKAALDSFSESGAQKTLDDEVYNGNKVCFGVRDTADNWGYGVSGLITGIDRTPPVITATPAGPSSNVKLTVTALASSTSFDIDENSWRHKVIPSATACNAVAMSSSTSSGLEVTISSETHNNHKVCFAAKDTAGNWAYDATGVITGIDRTAPTISVSGVVANQVSATVTDAGDNSPTFRSKIISDSTCDSTVSGFISYVSGTVLTLTAGSRACFYASDFLGNDRYVASAPGVDTEMVQSDTTPPTISVNPSSPDSSPKRSITVRASSSSSDVAAGSWKHKIIPASTACDADAVASATTAGRSAYLASESNNHHKVCFAVKDTSNNWNHAASGTISGIDRTAPVIAVGDVSNNRVSATVSDNVDSSPAFKSQVIGDSVCSSLTGGSFDTYLSGTELTLAVDSRACFYAADSAGNVAYESSAAAVYIAPPPNSPPTVNVGGVSRNNRVSATIDGDLTNSPILEIRLISDSDCGPDTAGTFNPYTPGTSIILSAGSRACFRLTDNTNHQDYAVSAAGSTPQQSGGNTQRSRNPPARPPAKAGLKVTVMTGEKTVRASDNYDPGQTTMSYRVQPTTSCPGSAASGFKAYQEGTALVPAGIDSDYYVCFRSVDKDDSTNVAYAVSELVVVEPDPGPADDEVGPDPSAPTVAPISDDRPPPEPIAVTSPIPGSGGDTSPDPDPSADPDDKTGPDPDDGEADDRTETEPPPGSTDNEDEIGINPPADPDLDDAGFPFGLAGMGLVILLLILAIARRVSRRD